MKYLLIIILIFTTNCFAIDQKLIAANKQYSVIELKLSEITNKIRRTKEELEVTSGWLKWEEDKTGNFRTESSIKNHQSEITEKQNLLNTLIAQQIETKKILQKLEPLKDEYYRQKEKEYERQGLRDKIIVIIIILTFIVVFGLVIRLIITQQKKYQKLLAEGKITQTEYDSIISAPDAKSTLFSSDRINPATGLRMTGGCDSGGNPYGCSFSSSSSDNYRTKWD